MKRNLLLLGLFLSAGGLQAASKTLCPANSTSVMANTDPGNIMTLHEATAEWLPAESENAPRILKVNFFPSAPGGSLSNAHLTPQGETNYLFSNINTQTTTPPWPHFTVGANGSFPITYSGRIDETRNPDDRSMVVRYKFLLDHLNAGSMYRIDIDSRYENRRCYHIDTTAIRANYPSFMNNIDVWCGKIQVYVQDDSQGDEAHAPKMPLLQPEAVDDPYISAASPTGHENFRESGTFRAGGPTAHLVIEAQGFVGDYVVDNITVTEITGAVADALADPYLSWPDVPAYAASQTPPTPPHGMDVNVTVGATNIKVQTYGGIFQLSENNNTLVIFAKAPNNTNLGSMVIGPLGGTLVSRDSKAHFMERFNYPNVMVAIGADSTLTIHIRDQAATINLNGTHGTANTYSAFDRGVVFQGMLVGDRGFFFAPVRPSMELLAKKATQPTWNAQFDDLVIGSTWTPNVPNFENVGGWSMVYQAPVRSWFVASIFPPRAAVANPLSSTGGLRFYSANFDPLRAPSLTSNAITASLDQFTKAPNRMGISFLNLYKYSSTLNPLNPPDDIGIPTEITGPMHVTAENEPKVRAYVESAHSRSPRIPVICYLSPEYYIQVPPSLLFKNIVDLMNIGFDGVYFDGTVQGHPLDYMLFMRMLRMYLDSFTPKKILIQHSSHEGQFSRKSEVYRVPFTDTFADVILGGEANWNGWDVPKFDNSTQNGNISVTNKKVIYPPLHSDVAHYGTNPLPYVKSCPPLWGLMYAGKASNAAMYIMPEFRPRDDAALQNYMTAWITANPSKNNSVDISLMMSQKLTEQTTDLGSVVPLSPSQQIAAQTTCGGSIYADPMDLVVLGSGFEPTYTLPVLNFRAGKANAYFGKAAYLNCLNRAQGDAQSAPTLKLTNCIPSKDCDKKVSSYVRSQTTVEIPITDLTNPSDWWQCWLPQ